MRTFIFFMLLLGSTSFVSSQDTGRNQSRNCISFPHLGLQQTGILDSKGNFKRFRLSQMTLTYRYNWSRIDAFSAQTFLAASVFNPNYSGYMIGGALGYERTIHQAAKNLFIIATLNVNGARGGSFGYDKSGVVPYSELSNSFFQLGMSAGFGSEWRLCKHLSLDYYANLNFAFRKTKWNYQGISYIGDSINPFQNFNYSGKSPLKMYIFPNLMHNLGLSYHFGKM